MVVKNNSKLLPKFSFSGAQLYRNIDTNQYVIAVEILEHQIEQVKKLDYLQYCLKGHYIVNGDYIVLRHGKFSFIYGSETFNKNHLLVG